MIPASQKLTQRYPPQFLRASSQSSIEKYEKMRKKQLKRSMNNVMVLNHLAQEAQNQAKIHKNLDQTKYEHVNSGNLMAQRRIYQLQQFRKKQNLMQEGMNKTQGFQPLSQRNVQLLKTMALVGSAVGLTAPVTAAVIGASVLGKLGYDWLTSDSPKQTEKQKKTKK